jgi:hypothetical protein
VPVYDGAANQEAFLLCYRQLTKHSSTLCNLWIQQCVSLSLPPFAFARELKKTAAEAMADLCFLRPRLRTRFVKVCEKEKGAEVVRQVKKTLPQRCVSLTFGKQMARVCSPTDDRTYTHWRGREQDGGLLAYLDVLLSRGLLHRDLHQAHQ